jgi:tetratricopeptide (TPR) repeat protein
MNNKLMMILSELLILTALSSPNSDHYVKKNQDKTKSQLEQLILDPDIELTTFTLNAEKLRGYDVNDSIYVITNNLINSIINDTNLIKLSNKKELDIKDAEIFAKIPLQKIRKKFNYRNMNLLSEAIKEKNIDCYLGSLIYISCADKLGLDVRYVLLPHLREKSKLNQIHGLVRFYFDKENYVNIETTNGRVYSDEHLWERYKVTNMMVKNKAFFNSYTKNELKSEILTAISYDPTMMKELFLKKSLELNPNSYLGNQVLAAHLYNTKRFDEAIKYYKKLIQLYPENDKLHGYLEKCYTHLEQTKLR